MSENIDAAKIRDFWHWVPLEAKLLKVTHAVIPTVCVFTCTQKLQTSNLPIPNDAWRTHSDVTTWPLATSRHLSPPRQVSARLAPLVWSSTVFLLPCSSDKSFSAVSCMSYICRRCKRRFSQNMKIKSGIILVDTVDVLASTFAVWTRPSLRGRSSATKSRLAARETGNERADTDCGKSLDRTESVARCSRERPGRREAPGWDKSVSSSSPTHSPCPEM